MRSAGGRFVRWAGTTVLAVALTSGAAGCGSSEPTTREAAAEETAVTVCDMLRRWNNEMADVMNATSEAITDADDPDTANATLLDGFDDLIGLAERHRAELDDLALPFTDQRGRLIDDLRGGADDAIGGLEDKRAEIEELPPITVAAQGGAIGGALIAVERADSVVEPPIGTYADEELMAAFAANDGCDHVIQPF
jgi:hypothetical protein